MSALLEKLHKNTTIKFTADLMKSTVYGKKDSIATKIPMINVALSGDVEGGLSAGITELAGPSKHFKTLFGLLMAAAFLEKYKDSILLFYDSEFGTPEKYFDSLGIDKARVIHTPITDIEELKSDIMVQLSNIERKDKIVIMIDSIGNLASRKEIEDALKGNVVSDMTRAKALKSLFRMVTPHLTIKDIPLIVINHSYQTLEMFSKAVPSGGTGLYYSADTIWILGRQQNKVKDEVDGYHFIINVEKSRFVKEKSKIPITVSYSNGINTYSGFLENAIEAKLVTKSSPGKYSLVDENGEVGDIAYKENDILTNATIWENILATTKFKEFLHDKYSLSGTDSLISNSDIEKLGETDERE